VLATGIERVAVGAAITQSSDPAGEARRWLEALSP
jgi:thiamine monophosphate synthase